MSISRPMKERRRVDVVKDGPSLIRDILCISANRWLNLLFNRLSSALSVLHTTISTFQQLPLFNWLILRD